MAACAKRWDWRAAQFARSQCRMTASFNDGSSSESFLATRVQNFSKAPCTSAVSPSCILCCTPPVQPLSQHADKLLSVCAATNFRLSIDFRFPWLGANQSNVATRFARPPLGWRMCISMDAGLVRTRHQFRLTMQFTLLSTLAKLKEHYIILYYGSNLLACSRSKVNSPYDSLQ